MIHTNQPALGTFVPLETDLWLRTIIEEMARLLAVGIVAQTDRGNTRAFRFNETSRALEYWTGDEWQEIFTISTSDGQRARLRLNASGQTWFLEASIDDGQTWRAI